ncbi:MAG: hypothetical protein GX182_02220 [Firmicutes bacterium]|nr:hypothetical protein [Bacillota bacterium]
MQRKTNVSLFFITAVLLGFALWKGGPSLAGQGLISGLQQLLRVIPMVAAAFLAAGLMKRLITPKLINHWLGQKAGWRGLFIGWLAGSLIPGGPYVYYPIALSLVHSSIGMGPLMAFVLGKQLSSLERLLVEFPFLGPRLTMVRFALTWFFPLLLALLSSLIWPMAGELPDKEAS